MFKKPFNKKVGETRSCKVCDNQFHTFKPIWRCPKCVNAAQKIIEAKKRAEYDKKDKYPFDTRGNSAARRFLSIRTRLSNAWKEYNRTGDKTAIRNHYNNQLKEIQENGIMTWILDRRTYEARMEGKPKSYNKTRKEYPSTKEMPN